MTTTDAFFLERYVGTYSPVIDPSTGQIAAGIAGLDIPYVGRLLFLLICVSVFCTLLISFIRRWK